MKAYLVEDNDSMRLILKRLLRKNFPSITEVRESDNAETALTEIPDFTPDLVLVDISLPGMDGIEMIRQLKPDCQQTCILVVTGHDISLYKDASLNAGAHYIVSKFEDEELLRSIRLMLDKKKNQQCD